MAAVLDVFSFLNYEIEENQKLKNNAVSIDAVCHPSSQYILKPPKVTLLIVSNFLIVSIIML